MTFINFATIPFSFHSGSSWIMYKHVTFPVFICHVHVMEELFGIEWVHRNSGIKKLAFLFLSVRVFLRFSEGHLCLCPSFLWPHGASHISVESQSVNKLQS